jgi:hypothetical protein
VTPDGTLRHREWTEKSVAGRGTCVAIGTVNRAEAQTLNARDFSRNVRSAIGFSGGEA